MQDRSSHRKSFGEVKRKREKQGARRSELVFSDELQLYPYRRKGIGSKQDHLTWPFLKISSFYEERERERDSKLASTYRADMGELEPARRFTL